MRALRKHGIVAEVDEVVVAESGEEAVDFLLAEGSHGGRGTILTSSRPSSSFWTCIFPGWTAYRSCDGCATASGRTWCL